MARKTPQVHNNRLSSAAPDAAGQPGVEVGSVEWYRWLAQHSTFAFVGSSGNFTARREQRSGNDYWYAYRKQGGRLHKLYLGRAADLTVARLNDTASQLAALVDDPTAVTKQDDPPLSTKFVPARSARSLVERARLYEKLDYAVAQRLTLVSAAPGFGKTTLLAAWCAAHPGQCVAWITLDSSDNDPARFWRGSLMALSHAYPGLVEMPLALINASTALHPIPIETVLVALINASAAFESPVILILDDYQVIQAQPVHDSLTFFLEHAPSTMHLILSSRIDPPLALMRLRAKGQLAEIRANELQFNSSETARFLKETMALSLSTVQVDVLHRRTEGWIAGLLLAALSIAGSADAATFLASFGGTDRYIVDYLVSEILEQQPAEIQRFLLQTAVLNRLCAPLAEALTDDRRAQAVLEYLEQANLFLVSLDNQRQWYRYHPLFAEVLRAQLTQQFPAQVTDLHRRAAHWYADHNLHDEAIVHALAARDLEMVADLMAQYAPSLLRHGELASLLNWLPLIPDAMILSRPGLGLNLAAALLAVGRVAEGAQRIEAIERANESELRQEPAWYGECAALHMMIAVIEGQTADILPYAQVALRLLPSGDLFMRGFVTWALAAAQFLSDGNAVDALRAFNQAAAVNRAAGNLVMLLWALYSRAAFEALNGRLHQAAQTCQESIELTRIGSAASLPMAALGYLGLGDVLREWNRLEEAEHHLMEGLKLGQAWATTEFLVDGTITLARLKQAQRRGQEALAALDELESVMDQQPVSLVTRQVVAAHRARLWLRQGNLQAARAWAQQVTTREGHDQRQQSSPWLIEIEDMVCARVLIAEGQTAHALQRLEILASTAQSAGRITSLIEMRILQALTLQATGRPKEGLAPLQQAVHLAEPEGCIRLFADEGLALAELLRALAPQSDSGATRGYLEQILVAIDKDNASPNQALAEPLTDRELEILRLIAIGYTNHDIAAALVLGVSTVKWHVSNLLGKLNTERRDQAVRQAQDLGLL